MGDPLVDPLGVAPTTPPGGATPTQVSAQPGGSAGLPNWLAAQAGKHIGRPAMPTGTATAEQPVAH